MRNDSASARSTGIVRLFAAMGTLGLAIATACSSSNAPISTGDAGSSGSSGSSGDAATASTDSGAGKSEAGADASPTDGASTFALTSPAFTEGQPIPTQYTCGGADTSPELDWTGGPAAAQSYALVVTDLDTGGVTNDAGVVSTPNIHWVIWDMPTTVLGLPAMLPTAATLTSPVMANQVDLRTTAADSGTSMNGYFGPCPGGNVHRYQFALHAMDVATLPGVTTSTTSTNVKAAVLQHSIAEADLTGTSNAVRLVVSDAGDAAAE